jgi:hypothetical protein
MGVPHKHTRLHDGYFSSIDDLSLYRWDKYTSAKDNNWFLLDYDGRQKKIDTSELKAIEESLQDQYFKAIDDNAFKSKIQKWAQIDNLKLKYNTVDSLLNCMWMGFGNDEKEQEQRYLVIKQLRSWGFKFPELNNVVSDRDLIVNFRIALEGIKTQIAIISNELVDDGKKESHSLAKQLQIATVGLQYPYRLNPKEITVSEWIEICKLLNEKSKLN